MRYSLPWVAMHVKLGICMFFVTFQNVRREPVLCPPSIRTSNGRAIVHPWIYRFYQDGIFRAHRQDAVDELFAALLAHQRLVQPHGSAEHQGLSRKQPQQHEQERIVRVKYSSR